MTTIPRKKTSAPSAARSYRYSAANALGRDRRGEGASLHIPPSKRNPERTPQPHESSPGASDACTIKVRVAANAVLVARGIIGVSFRLPYNNVKKQMYQIVRFTHIH